MYGRHQLMNFSIIDLLWNKKEMGRWSKEHSKILKIFLELVGKKLLLK